MAREEPVPSRQAHAAVREPRLVQHACEGVAGEVGKRVAHVLEMVGPDGVPRWVVGAGGVCRVVWVGAEAVVERYDSGEVVGFLVAGGGGEEGGEGGEDGGGGDEGVAEGAAVEVEEGVAGGGGRGGGEVEG